MSLSDNLNLGLSDAIQSVKNSLGLGSAANNKMSAGYLPWTNNSSGTNSQSQSVFFNPITILPQRWNQLFPYRLAVIDTTKNNAIVTGTSTSATTPGNASLVQNETGTTITFTPFSNQWLFTLPITPQQLNITDQFAINTTATLRGILEEHNGVKFKMINISATLGVWPYRESVTKPPSSPPLIQSLFGGTLTAIDNLASQVSGLVNTVTNGHPANKPTTILPELSTDGPSSTGYYQAIALQQFLEQYAEAKKVPANAGWRLVLDMPKQNQSLVVTPMQFTWQQNVNKPMEVSFNLQMKSWRRLDKPIGQASLAAKSTVQPLTPGILQRVLNTLSQAQTTVSAAINIIAAVRNDINTPLDALRQTKLFVKGLTGTPLTSADLPAQSIKDYSGAIQQAMASQYSTIAGNITDPTSRSNLSTITANAASNEGLNSNAVSSGQLGLTASNAQAASPSNNVFTQPQGSFLLLDQISMSSLQLSNAQQVFVNNLMTTAAQTTVAQLKAYRATIQTLVLQLSNSFGAGNAYYDMVYGLPSPLSRSLPMTLDEYDLLDSLYEVLQSYDILTATNQIDDDQFQNNMNYVAGLATTSGIPFDVPSSMILAPVPFGLTIEAIAARYLSDPQRWIEIATLNNLRDPYIDENGFQLPLLSNATGRQVTVADSSNLYIGQIATLMGANQTPVSRTILGIDMLSSSDYLITLDGLANLDNFTTLAQSYLQVYLPGTVNSQQKIFIPSDLPIPNDPDITVPPTTSSDPLTGLSQVDLLLTEDGDLAVNNYGDLRFSYGLTNIIQALRIKFGTEQGKSLLHPEFGLNVRPGTNSADTDIQNIYNSINNLVQNDPRFSGLSSLQIVLNGPVLTINLAVNMAGNSGVFPLTFQLTT